MTNNDKSNSNNPNDKPETTAPMDPKVPVIEGDKTGQTGSSSTEGKPEVTEPKSTTSR